jgi:hypothetical protein
MEKFQIKNGWITIEKPQYLSDYLSISMKLTEVCSISTKRETYLGYSYSINISGSGDPGLSPGLSIVYFENEFEEFNNDLKYIQEMISKT